MYLDSVCLNVGCVAGGNVSIRVVANVRDVGHIYLLAETYCCVHRLPLSQSAVGPWI